MRCNREVDVGQKSHAIRKFVATLVHVADKPDRQPHLPARIQRRYGVVEQGKAVVNLADAAPDLPCLFLRHLHARAAQHAPLVLGEKHPIFVTTETPHRLRGVLLGHEGVCEVVAPQNSLRRYADAEVRKCFGLYLIARGTKPRQRVVQVKENGGNHSAPMIRYFSFSVWRYPAYPVFYVTLLPSH